jgi:hypothetical protein
MTYSFGEVCMKGITVIVILTIFSSFFACISTREITQKDEIRTILESDNRFFLYVDNNETYYFESPYSYQILNDTLIGVGRIVIDSSIGKTKRVKVELEGLQKLEVEKFDGIRTALGVGTVAVIGYFIYEIVDSSLDNMQLLGE